MVAILGLIGMGGVLLVIAIFYDPIGASPDSGVIELGPVGTRWLLGVLGSTFWIGGAWVMFKTRKSNSR